MTTLARLPALLLVLSMLAPPGSAAQASTGLTTLAAAGEHGPVTVLYPSSTAPAPVRREPFVIDLAAEGVPERGNGRLVVISHGSGGMPWIYTDLAITLVRAGFVVAMPEHRGDNADDPDSPGPESWRRRPLEVSHAIDAVAADPRLAPLLELDAVGMYGMSAGGHTALTLAGGRWSPARLRDHCEQFIAEDFQACVGLSARSTGGPFDGLKETVALWIIRSRFDDAAWYEHTDPRIAAIVAGVPFAADFDVASLAEPRAPLGLVTAARDRWLVPRFHSTPVLAACGSCEHVFHFADGGHGALMSPLPPDTSGLLAELIDDPPGFDRGQVAAMNDAVAEFFARHLLAAPGQRPAE